MMKPVVLENVNNDFDSKIKDLKSELHILYIKNEKIESQLSNANVKIKQFSKDKTQRASELVIANKELVYQNREKEKRASELVIANKELVYQNVEKEKRASELVIANKELVYQNREKEKLASELVIANKELVYQNVEKEKRASELVIANKELMIEGKEKEIRISEIVDLKDAQMFIEKQLFEKTLIAIGDGVISTDINKNVLFLNRVAEKLIGWTKEEAVGRPIYTVFNIINEITRLKGVDIIENVIKSKSIRYLSNHSILITRNGEEKLIEDSAAPILDKANKVIGVVVVFRDYTEKASQLNLINYMNLHDDLTGLYNRRFFEEELIRLDVKRNLPLSIIMGDVNGLKLVNDSFGHVIGDKLLKKTADSLREGCREDEILARLGGDEFVLIIPQCDKAQAEGIIERIQLSLSKKTINKLVISVSFGTSCKTEMDMNIQEVLRESEDLMYKHKLVESSSNRGRTIDLISKTLFEKNERELIHSKRVGVLSSKLGKKLGFESNRIHMLKLSGLLHDIGKIGIEDSILNKIGKLSDEEFIQIKKHPEIGYRILGSVLEFVDISRAVLQHHERWDGKGYPQGLKGKAIEIEARIITLADAYDAMTSQRTYRKRLSVNDALAEIKKCSGAQFDPTLAEIFIDMIQENPKI